MNKRETIIILLAVLLAVYGLLDYFVLGKKKSGSEEEKIKAAVTQAENFSKTAQARLLALGMNKDGRDLAYTRDKAEALWPRDPFIHYTTELEQQQVAEGEIPDMVYSGFIRLGKKMLGVINGMEYGIGELIVEIGYKVDQITPKKVVLLTQSNKQVTIYLQED